MGSNSGQKDFILIYFTSKWMMMYIEFAKEECLLKLFRKGNIDAGQKD